MSGFSARLGNPPYVFSRGNLDEGQKEFLKAQYPKAQYQANLYAFFILKELEESPNGTLGFITPNNWVTLLTGEYLRRELLGHTSEGQSKELEGEENTLQPHDVMIFGHAPGQFQDAAVDTLSLVVSPSSSRKHLSIASQSPVQLEASDEIPMFFFAQMDEHPQHQGIAFDVGIQSELIDPRRAISPRIFATDGALEFINHMANPKHASALSDVAEVKSGLVAYSEGRGDPSITKEMMKNRVYHSDRQIDDTWSKYLEGVDVERYNLNWSGNWILYGNNLSEPREARLYQGERIVVRQIPSALPYAICATIVNEEHINDRNSMIVKCDDSPYSIQFILGVLNSKFISTWFDYYFDKFQRNVFPQFKIAELREFPIPNLDMNTEEGKTIHDGLELLVKRRLETVNEDEVQSIEASIEEIVLAAFGSPHLPE